VALNSALVARNLPRGGKNKCIVALNSALVARNLPRGGKNKSIVAMIFRIGGTEFATWWQK
jgi:hypothetical protein